MASPSLVLFDLDDTLVDHRYATHKGLAALQKHYSPFSRIPLSDIETRASKILEETHQRVLKGSLSQEDGRQERFRLLLASYQHYEDKGTIAELTKYYRKSYRSHRRPVLGAVELLTELRKVVGIGIITNNFLKEQQSKLIQCGLASLVDFMVTSEETGFAKPAREIFVTALDLHGSAPERTVMVGDSWDSDIVGAIAAGIRPIWFNRSTTATPGELPVQQLHTFEHTDQALNLILEQR